MEHPFPKLKPEYAHLLSVMRVRPECEKLVDEVAVKLVGYKTRYEPVSQHDGVPVVFIAASFEREASSDFTRNAAQGWPLHTRSRWVPQNGPFPTWQASALAAYHLNGLDKVGGGNWTWELMCFYGELFNGFGYRDAYRMHSPYLWGGTNIQTPGKFVKDHEFDKNLMDPQLGIIPVMRRMIDLDQSLALPIPAYVPAPPIESGVAAVKGPDVAHDTAWVQGALNKLGFWPELKVDGNYGFMTKFSVEKFQADYGIHVDGLVGEETTLALAKALANVPEGSS